VWQARRAHCTPRGRSLPLCSVLPHRDRAAARCHASSLRSPFSRGQAARGFRCAHEAPPARHGTVGRTGSHQNMLHPPTPSSFGAEGCPTPASALTLTAVQSVRPLWPGRMTGVGGIRASFAPCPPNQKLRTLTDSCSRPDATPPIEMTKCAASREGSISEDAPIWVARSCASVLLFCIPSLPPVGAAPQTDTPRRASREPLHESRHLSAPDRHAPARGKLRRVVRWRFMINCRGSAGLRPFLPGIHALPLSQHSLNHENLWSARQS
jgi:hypothetical protein